MRKILRQRLRGVTALTGLAAMALGLGASGEAAALSAREVDYQDWRVRCETPASGGPERCTMFQGISTEDGGAQIMHIAVRNGPQQSVAIAYIAAPLGVYLPNGLGMRVDEGNLLRLPFEFCNGSGCHTRLKLEEPLLSSFKNGASASIEIVQFTNGKPFTAVVSLKGFTAAFDALK